MNLRKTVILDSLDFAAQESEERRLRLLIGVLTALGLFAVVRRLAGGLVLSGSVFWYSLGVLVVGICGVALAAVFTRRANKAHRLLPTWVGVALLVFELLIPTGAMVAQIVKPQLDAFTPLGAPVVLTYAILILLSILRLRVWMCLLAGTLAGALHLGAYVFTANWHGGANPLGAPFYGSYSAILVLIGAAAALVTREVRGYVRLALNEAETEAKLESLRHDLDIAKKIQEGLFPKTPPETPGYDIAGWSKPADQTGGDYYDWIALPNGRLAVMLGDVTGHGIGPALLMAICRAYTRATFPSQMELQEAMRRLNALLSEDVGEGRFITFAVAVLDPATGEVEVLSAGHGPILLRRTPGGACSLAETEGTGLPLGIMPEEDYGAPLRWKLEPGDTLLLVTDGFFEQGRDSDSQQYGVERLREFLKNNGHLDATTFIQSLHREVVGFAAGAKQNDDMTAAVIRRIRD